MNKCLSHITKCVLLLLAVLIISACEKVDFDTEDVVPAANGNLTVNVSMLDEIPLSFYTRANAANACKRLNFVVYDSNGKRVKQNNQQLGEAGYGTTSFQLPEGGYHLVVLAHSSDGNPTLTNPAKVQFTNAKGFTNTFVYSGFVTIGDQPQQLKADLNCISALCRFIITDDFPSDVKKMRFYYTGGSGTLDANVGFGCVKSKQDLKFDVTATQKQFDLYTFLHDTEGTIHLTVSALDASGVEIHQREFDVPMTCNRISWVECDYFEESSIPNVRVSTESIAKEWEGEFHLTF